MEALDLWADLEASTVPAVDVLLTDPAVVAFAEQFGADVSVITDEQRSAFHAATGDQAFGVVQAVWLRDMAPRLHAGVALAGRAATQEGGRAATKERRRDPVNLADRWPLIDAFMQAVARRTALDPRLTELVRLRGARQHDCRLCASRRSQDAIDAGAGDEDFAAVDDHAASDLPDAAKAALALVDALIWTPTGIPADVAEGVRSHLTEEQAVEVVLDVVRNAANKIAVALRADAAEVTEGVQLFTTDADGTLTVVG